VIGVRADSAIDIRLLAPRPHDRRHTARGRPDIRSIQAPLMDVRPVIFYSSNAAGRPAQAACHPPRVRKAFSRRRGDLSQQIRFGVQLAFGLMTLAVGVQFVLWVRYFEAGGTTLRVDRPDGVEAWLPIASLMNLKTLILTGAVPEIHAAGLFMLIAFLGISFLNRKAFCSWICPVGTISEWLWQTGRSLLGRTVAAPRWLDVPLRGLKYILFRCSLTSWSRCPYPRSRRSSAARTDWLPTSRCSISFATWAARLRSSWPC
jgi:4Fe-4S binding domain